MTPPCSRPTALSSGSQPDSSAALQAVAGPGSEAQQQRMRMQYVQKQQRWLLFLRHCAKCTQSEESCQYKRNCRIGKELWHHIRTCADPACQFPRCVGSRELLKHHQKCRVRGYCKCLTGTHLRQQAVMLDLTCACLRSPDCASLS